MVRSCEDIVHVDSMSTSTLSLDYSEGRSSHQHLTPTSSTSTSHISEIFASTRAYPTWWSELDESRILRRRKSNNEIVLERNLCFIDTPGFNESSAPQRAIDTVVEYIESLFWRNQSISTLRDGDVLSILSGNGGPQVDLVIYVLPSKSIRRGLDIFMTKLHSRIS